MRLTASQIRQDLNCFGGFGQQGYGYNVKELREEIGAILHLGAKRRVILVGAGNLGRAIALHIDFPRYGWELAAVFDRDDTLSGKASRGSGYIPRTSCARSARRMLPIWRCCAYRARERLRS